jgi:hypothetical protein
VNTGRLKTMKTFLIDNSIMGSAAASRDKMVSIYDDIGFDMQKKIDSKPNNPVEFDYIHNHSSFVLDFFETFAQKFMEQGYTSKEAWRIVGDLRSKGIGFSNSNLTNPFVITGLLVQASTDENLLNLMKSGEVIEQEDVDKIYTKVRGDLLDGHRVILVSHSQGGLFSSGSLDPYSYEFELSGITPDNLHGKEYNIKVDIVGIDKYGMSSSSGGDEITIFDAAVTSCSRDSCCQNGYTYGESENGNNSNSRFYWQLCRKPSELG